MARVGLRGPGHRLTAKLAASVRVPRLRADHYPVARESRTTVEAAAGRKLALCPNDRPPFGIADGSVDVVPTDDFSGGACAAELRQAHTGCAAGCAILGAPADAAPSVQRIAGFRAHSTGARLIRADSWFVEDGLDRSEAVLAGNPVGIFACNDRLAEALIRYCRLHRRPLPALVGFDHAPVAERLRLTTIGIPWRSMVAEAVKIVATRLAGGTDAARLVSLAHEPVLRLTT